METASSAGFVTMSRMQAPFIAFLLLAGRVFAAGTPAGTVIENTASVSFDLAGTPVTLTSNTTTLTVAERLDVAVTLVSPQQVVGAGDSNRALLFTVTNTGNGSERYTFAVDSALAGDDFDPLPSVPGIWFDTDGSGDFNVGDVAWDPGVNDPVLAADETIAVFVLNDIPAGAANGGVGNSALIASAATGSGAPGDEFAGQGDGGVDAIVGLSGAAAQAAGEYLVSDVGLSVVKAQSVADPFGGSQPLPGATITYTVTVEVTGAGTATGTVFDDPIPAYTSFVPASLTLNGANLTDAADGDAGELDAGSSSVVVRLGDLTQASGVQTVEFQVTID